MTNKARYKGTIWQLQISNEMAEEVERYLALRRAQERHRTVSRNEVLCELIGVGLFATSAVRDGGTK